jgi:hypothetical protein
MKTCLPSRLRAWATAHWPPALGAVLLLCALLPLASADKSTPTRPAPQRDAAEWPLEWAGETLQPLSHSAVEVRFANNFPGRIARFRMADSGDELVLRDVQRPTRMLHPAADCWRGIGWQVGAARLVRMGTSDPAPLWRCFEASRGGQRVRVCERIVDAEGQAFTDTSAWFWAASLGQSQGPWQAVTTIQGL